MVYGEPRFDSLDFVTVHAHPENPESRVGDLQLCLHIGLSSFVRLHFRPEAKALLGTEWSCGQCRELAKMCPKLGLCSCPTDVDSETRAPTKMTPRAMTSLCHFI